MVSARPRRLETCGLVPNGLRLAHTSSPGPIETCGLWSPPGDKEENTETVGVDYVLRDWWV